MRSNKQSIGVYSCGFFLQFASESRGSFSHIPMLQTTTCHNPEKLSRSIGKEGLSECLLNEHILKTNFLKRFLTGLIISLCLNAGMYSQDIHFSQFYNNPLYLSPALTGVSRGDIRFTGAYRSQWEKALAPFETYYAAVDKKYYDIGQESWWLNSGITIFHDKAGDARVTNNNISISGSYTRMLDLENFVSFGIYAGIGQRQFDFNNLTFDSQWNGFGFDPHLEKGESFDDENIMFPDLGAGVNWRGQKQATRSKVDIGFAAFHLNQPNQSYQRSDKSRLDPRLSFYFLPTLQVSNNLDLVGHGTAQVQGNYLEALAGAGGRFYISTKRSYEIAVQLGFGYRFNARGDALYPMVEFLYREWMVGLSWDLNVSNFSVATNRNGGPELTLRYIIHKVYPVRAFKACPLI